MNSNNRSAPRSYIGIVFKEAPPTADFSCSTEVVLPGVHTQQEAWAAVRAACAEGSYIGGEVRPCHSKL